MLPNIRAYLLAAEGLDQLLETHDLCFIKKTILDRWIQSRHEGLGILIDFFHDLGRRVNIHVTDSSFLQDKMVLHLIIHVVEKQDRFINVIFRFGQDQNPQIDPRFRQDSFEMIRTKIALFCEFVDCNGSYMNVEFVAGKKYADEFKMRRDVFTILYRDGSTTNFEIPSQPGQQ